MAVNTNYFIDLSRKLRSAALGPLAKQMVRLGIKADHVTAFSLACGIAAAFFLFRNHTIFAVLAVLHLLSDAFDGVVARASPKEPDGAFLDYFSDRIVTVALLGAAFLNLWEPLIIAALALKIVHQGIYMFSGFRLPVLYSRTFLLLFYAFGLYNLGHIFVLAANSLGIVLQFYHLLRFRPR